MLPGITIDSASSRDLDDAVWAVPEGDLIRLWIAIADVSGSVAPQSLAMQEALVLLESRYRGSKCSRPMLSETITEHHSLLPDRDRPVLALELLLQEDGSILETQFRRDRLRSQGRITYDMADRVLAGELDHPFAEQLETLSQAAGWLDRARCGVWGHAVGGEFRDDVGAVVKGSHQLIASTAIAYNAQAAERLAAAQCRALYRVQDVLGEDEFATIIREVNEDPEVLAPLIAHRLPRAEHRPHVAPHWALKLPGYARCTSPLRRVEDTINQQQLLSVIAGEDTIWSERLLAGMCERLRDLVAAREAYHRQQTIDKAPVSIPQIATVTANQLAGLLERADESGEVSEGLRGALAIWLQEDRLTARHAALILSGSFDRELQEQVLAVVEEGRPHLNAVSVGNTLGQLGKGAVAYRYESEGGRWRCFGQWQQLAAMAVATSKSDSRSQCARELLRLAIARERSTTAVAAERTASPMS